MSGSLAMLAGKKLPAFSAHAHLQLSISGKRPMPEVTVGRETRDVAPFFCYIEDWVRVHNCRLRIRSSEFSYMNRQHLIVWLDPTKTPYTRVYIYRIHYTTLFACEIALSYISLIVTGGCITYHCVDCICTWHTAIASVMSRLPIVVKYSMSY